MKFRILWIVSFYLLSCKSRTSSTLSDKGKSRSDYQAKLDACIVNLKGKMTEPWTMAFQKTPDGSLEQLKNLKKYTLDPDSLGYSVGRRDSTGITRELLSSHRRADDLYLLKVKTSVEFSPEKQLKVDHSSKNSLPKLEFTVSIEKFLRPLQKEDKSEIIGETKLSFLVDYDQNCTLFLAKEESVYFTKLKGKITATVSAYDIRKPEFKSEDIDLEEKLFQNYSKFKQIDEEIFVQDKMSFDIPVLKKNAPLAKFQITPLTEMTSVFVPHRASLLPAKWVLIEMFSNGVPTLSGRIATVGEGASAITIANFEELDQTIEGTDFDTWNKIPFIYRVDLKGPPTVGFRPEDFSNEKHPPTKYRVLSSAKLFYDNFQQYFDLVEKNNSNYEYEVSLRRLSAPKNLDMKIPTGFPADVQEFLKQTEYYDFDNPIVKSFVEEVKKDRGANESYAVTLSALLTRLNETVIYDHAAVEADTNDVAKASETITKRSGVCSNFSIVFVAAARALRIPSRSIYGFALSGSEDDEPTGGGPHAWVEFYIPDWGWQPIEPQHPTRTYLKQSNFFPVMPFEIGLGEKTRMTTEQLKDFPNIIKSLRFEKIPSQSPLTPEQIKLLMSLL